MEANRKISHAVAVPKIWVAQLAISERTAQKIEHKHGVTPGEVRDAVCCVKGLNAWSEDHIDHGLRWFVRVAIRGGMHLVVLYPSPYDSDVFALGSCYPSEG